MCASGASRTRSRAARTRPGPTRSAGGHRTALPAWPAARVPRCGRGARPAGRARRLGSRRRDRRRGHRRMRVGCMFFMPETGFRRQPSSERKRPSSQLKSTALGGARFRVGGPDHPAAHLGLELFMGDVERGVDRLKEAHFLRDIGLPGGRPPRSGRLVRALLACRDGAGLRGDRPPDQTRGARGAGGPSRPGSSASTAMEMATLFVFAITGNWVRSRPPGRLFRPRPAGARSTTTWLNEEITDSSCEPR